MRQCATWSNRLALLSWGRRRCGVQTEQRSSAEPGAAAEMLAKRCANLFHARVLLFYSLTEQAHHLDYANKAPGFTVACWQVHVPCTVRSVHMFSSLSKLQPLTRQQHHLLHLHVCIVLLQGCTMLRCCSKHGGAGRYCKYTLQCCVVLAQLCCMTMLSCCIGALPCCCLLLMHCRAVLLLAAAALHNAAPAFIYTSCCPCPYCGVMSRLGRQALCILNFPGSSATRPVQLHRLCLHTCFCCSCCCIC